VSILLILRIISLIYVLLIAGMGGIDSWMLIAKLFVKWKPCGKPLLNPFGYILFLDESYIDNTKKY